MKHLITYVLFIQFSLIAFGQEKLSLKIASGEYAVSLSQARSLTQSLVSEWPEHAGNKYGLIVLETMLQADEIKTLNAGGVEVLEYLPTAFYLVSISKETSDEVLSQLAIKTAIPFEKQYKSIIDTEFPPSRAMFEDGKLLVNIHPFSNVSLEELKGAVLNDNVVLVDERKTYQFITVALEANALTEVLENGAVQFADWNYEYGEPENYTGRSLHRTNYLSGENTNGLNYSGEGINVALQDDGSIGPHIDHHGRIKEQFWATSLGNHGDHVGGTINGAGNLNPYHEGQAKGSDLYVYKAAPEYQAFDSVDSHYESLDVVITSTSYSNGCNAGYTALARVMDEQTRDHESLIHVFSAGNSGTSNCGYGAGSFWGNITGGHKVGKNVMTVANLTLFDEIAGSSSRGPAHDGRIKPDISAKGTNVTSTIAGNQYDTYTGTSMSCPGVSGTLAQLYEAYDDLYGTLPPSGLLKAIVLNTADDLGNVGPDFTYGWGRINARKAFNLMEDGTIENGTITTNAQSSHTLNVTGEQKELRIMLYWTDVEASVNASTALVNDLDIKVITPSGDSLSPFVLDPTPHPDSLDNPAVAGEDRLNNVEQVVIADPNPGAYTILVNGYSIPFGPQEYYVVSYIEPEGVTLTYPVGGESLVPTIGSNPPEVIRWDHHSIGTQIDIEYSNDGGLTWNSIATGVDASQEYYTWNVPGSNLTGKFRVRIIDGANISESDDFSVMERVTGLGVGWACPDSMGLVWDILPDAQSYDIYMLGDKYMDSIGTATGMEYVHYGSNPYSEDLWFAISSDGPDGAKSKRSLAVNKQPGVYNCFLARDLSALSLAPDIQSVFDCFGEGMEVSFVVENTGVTPLSGFTASFYGPGGVIVTDSFTSNMSPGSIDTFSFSSIVNLVQGEEEYFLLLELAGDLNRYNDTLKRVYNRIDAPAITPIWGDDFDAYSTCSDASDCSFTVCDIPGGWTNVTNGVNDDIDWRVYTGQTPTSFTGPNGDNTTAGANGNYIYLEASGECTFQEAHLLTPCIDLEGAETPVLSFYYNMYGANMGNLHVDVFDGSEWHEDVMEPLIGFQSNNWRNKEVDLSEFIDQAIVVRFRGITGSSFRSDLALDDISILHPPIANFEFSPLNDGQTIVLNDLSLYGDTMTFDLGDGSVLLDSVPSSHVYAQQQTYTLTQTVTNSVGSDTKSLDVNNLSVGELSLDEIRVYPNPTQGQLTVESLASTGLGVIEIISIDGRIVYRSEESRHEVTIDLSELASGMYYLSIPSFSVNNEPVVLMP